MRHSESISQSLIEGNEPNKIPFKSTHMQGDSDKIFHERSKDKSKHCLCFQEVLDPVMNYMNAIWHRL